MRRYNFKRVAIRVAVASAIAALFALSIHFPKYAWPPVICNGGFTDAIVDGIVFIFALFIAMVLVEGFHWLGWLMRRAPSASTQARDSAEVLSPTGGRLFSPVGAVSSIVLALFVLGVVRSYIGPLTPCERVDPSEISKRLIVGAILEAYGLLLLAEAILRKFPRRPVR
jgi:hypothetical protein